MPPKKEQPSCFKPKKEEKSAKRMVVYRKQVYLIAIPSPSKQRLFLLTACSSLW
jgi:hypothetical protein